MLLLLWAGGFFIGVAIGGRLGFWIADRVHAEEVAGDVEQERERCATLVEARGCICGFLLAARPAFEFRGKRGAGGRLEQHDPNCPRALATKIREVP